MFQTLDFLPSGQLIDPNAGQLQTLGPMQQQQLPFLPILPLLPYCISDNDINVMFPGPPGPPGPPGTPGLVPVTDVATSTYTALSTDYFLCVLTNGLVTITLPLGILGTVYIVKDCYGDAVTNPITIQGTAGQLIDGSIAIINTNFGSLQFIFNGTDWSIV